MSEWRDIQTAPMDGTWVLGWWPEDQWKLCHMKWDVADNLDISVPHWCKFGHWTPEENPTHWRPLLDPPCKDDE